MTSPSPWVDLAARLNREWAELVAGTPTTTLDRWGRAHPHLARLTSLDDIEARITEHAGDYATRDGILLALVMLTQDGHQLAGRVLIHLLRKGLSAAVKDTAHTLRKAGSTADGADAGEQILGTLWETIATYPLHRTSHVAANLLLDTRRILTQGNSARTPTPGLTSPATRHEIPTPDDDGIYQGFTPAAEDTYIANTTLDPTDQLADLLAWATTTQVITTTEAAFLTDICATPPPGTRYAYTHAATRHGITPATARQRACRLTTRIRAALPTQVA